MHLLVALAVSAAGLDLAPAAAPGAVNTQAIRHELALGFFGVKLRWTTLQDLLAPVGPTGRALASGMPR
jgi:hypothetical protein